MRRPRTAACVLVVAAGCFSPDLGPRQANWFDRVREQTGAALADGLVLRTGLIELPPGDPFLTTELWAAAGKPVPHEQAVLLARNGLRVGVLGGLTPARFDALTASDATFKFGTDRTFKPGAPRVVPVNGPLDRAAVRTVADLSADPAERTFTAAECGLSVTARPAAGGRVTLTCEPQVQYGDKELFLTAAADGSGFARTDHKPREAYPALRFEVTLAADEYLVVGPTAEPDGTLGQALFFDAADGRVRQRVLVIRATAGAGGAPDAATFAPAAAAGR
ncbi:MAG: hypothetical protein U0871_13370 [Gemmataceae bacterium]